MFKVSFRGTEVQLPEALHEATPEQYQRYLLLTGALAAGIYTTEEWARHWAAALLGLRPAAVALLRPETLAELEQVAEAVNIRYLTGEEESRGVNYNCTANLLPEFEGHKGPGDWLDGMTYGEFTACCSLMARERTANTYEELARIMYHIPEGEQVPEVLQLHCLLFFDYVTTLITTAPVEINGRLVDVSLVFKSTGAERKDDNTGWLGVTFEVASAGVFGTAKEVENTDFWEVLVYLYKCKFEYITNSND